MSRIETSGGKSSTPVPSNPAQINAQSLSQDWTVYSGTLYIYDSLTLNGYTLTLGATATVGID